MATKIYNPKAFADLNKRLEQLGDAQTKVGWFESSLYPDGRPVAAVAAGNEIGIAARSIPARPMFKPTVAKNRAKWEEIAGDLVKEVIAGAVTAFDAMDAFGQVVEDDVAETIATITSPPLSPITLGARKYKQMGKKITGSVIGEIARKLKEGKLDVSGVSDKPLEDSFTMFNTLTHTTESKK